jgi:glycosyltransferase involved in cell wall biosynthesis
MTPVDILIPTYDRPSALAITLCSLLGQTSRDFRVVISDQHDTEDVAARGEVAAVLRVLQAQRHALEVHKHLPRRGMAEQRQFLLDQVTAPYCLFLDDDVIVEPEVVERMLTVISSERCGFVGCALHGLSYVPDIRPHQEAIELWDGPVEPEIVLPGTAQWERHKLHSAANLYHVQQRLCTNPAHIYRYKVAWVGGCVLFDTVKLRAAGGYSFWPALPVNHCGEDVLAQQRVMARYGGCGILPSGVYHQELPTTVPDRRINAPEALRDTEWAPERMSSATRRGGERVPVTAGSHGGRQEEQTEAPPRGA